MEQLATAHRDGKVRRLRDVRSDLPRPFVNAVDRALEHDPAARFQSAGEMEAALEGPAAFRAPVDVVTPARQAAQWRPAFVAMAAATVLAVTGLIFWATPWRAHVSVPDGATTVAVLPFKDVSPTPVPDLADGFTEDLIGSLGKFTGLRVMSLPSAKAYAVNRAGLGPGDVAGAPLGADVIVEGTIARPAEKAGQQTAPARITATLRRASDGASLWSGSFNWVPGSSESLQAAIAAAVASSLRVGAPAGTAVPRTQSNPIAEQWEMRGRTALNDYGTEGSRRAVDAFSQAVQADSNFARAYGGLSRAYVRLGQFDGLPMQEARQQALIAMRRALELDANQADAHLASADLTFFYDWDWTRAEKEYLHALELNPSLTRARMNLAELYAAKRDFTSAFVQADQARQLDTTSEAARSYAVLLIYANRLDEADTLLDQILRSESNDAHAYLLKGRVAEGRGEFARAYDLMERAAALSNGGGVPLQVAIATLRAKSGDLETAKTRWQALEAESASGTIRLTHRDRAYMKLALGDRDGAIADFERALDERDWSLVWLTVDPRVDSLRGNPRFEAILKHIGLV
jgi:serine/threonine-protein kinase